MESLLPTEVYMTQEPASPDPRPDPASPPDSGWEAWLAFVERSEDGEPPDLWEREEYEDPGEQAEVIAEARQAAAALKHAAVAALIRRRPAPGCTPRGPAHMPEAWDEFADAELAPALGESRITMEGLLDLAHDLEVKLPGTRALFRDGIISRYKA